MLAGVVLYVYCVLSGCCVHDWFLYLMYYFCDEVAPVLGSIYLRQRERLNASRTRDND